MVFLAPGQTIIPLGAAAETDTVSDHGWTLMFHPDVLVGTSLAARIRGYGFFQYAPKEALHLDHGEQVTLTALVRTIDDEAKAPDAFSTDVLSAHLQLLFG